MNRHFRIQLIFVGLFLIFAVSLPLFVHAQNTVPQEYKKEIRDVLLSGKISSNVNSGQFDAFVDALSQKAYSANVTGADLTDARVEALLGSAVTGFNSAAAQAPQTREPNGLFLWGTVALLILIGLVARKYRRMYYGGALGPQ